MLQQFKQYVASYTGGWTLLLSRHEPWTLPVLITDCTDCYYGTTSETIAVWLNLVHNLHCLAGQQ